MLDPRAASDLASLHAEDDRVELPPPQLRPLTSEARTRRPALGFASLQPSKAQMPPIFPAPFSIQGQAPATKRRTFLPQLSHAKTFAVRNRDTEEGDDEMDLSSQPLAEEDTEAFKRAMWAGQANILVTVRVRPHCSHDRDDKEIVRVLDNKLIVVLDKHQQSDSPQRKSVVLGEPLPVAVLARRSHHGGLKKPKPRNAASAFPTRTTSNNQVQGSRSREKRYAFDYVFTPQDGQQTVYHHTTKFLIHGVLNGFNATVFAYGCTGAGKTYTMLGTPDEPGIMALTLDDLFQNIERVHTDPQSTVVYKVTVSFLEVYNENIRDLLVTPPPFGTVPGSSTAASEFLDLREDPVKGPVVAGISEVEASNAQDVMKLLRRGNKHRSQEATAANAVSSRSHAVLQVLVEQRDKNSSSESFGLDPSRGGAMMSTVKYGKLSLVDLAGSERAAVTQNRGQRLIEGANINRSLLALGNCINALGEKGFGASGGGFVPYRDSKLTRLLKDSLGGNCRTVMIANVSPASASVEETLNTLKYANRAKNIKTTVTRNVLNVDHHLTEYAGVVADLKDEIATLKKQLANSGGTSPGYFMTRTSPGRGKESRETPNNEDKGENHQNDEAWKHARLIEARGYISQCFQQRQQLRRSLFEIDHCINELNKRLGQEASSGEATDEPEHGGQESNKSAKGEHRDFATAILEDVVGDSVRQQVDDTSDEMERVEIGIRQLLAKKAQLVAQLERNQSVMDDFRAGIEQSPVFVTNELLRDLLLMEYRLGDLQVENTVMSVKEKLKDHRIAQLEARLSGHEQGVASFETNFLCKNVGEILTLDLPAPFTEMARLLSPPETKPEADETPELQSARSSTGFAFLDELRDRFYDRSRHQQQSSQVSSHSESNKGGSKLSPRRQWGIHLSNTSLPYIRIKKKVPPALTNASTMSNTSSIADNASGVDVTGHLRGSATTPAPYLKVLKHRRKLQHRSNMNNSNSHKKLPGVVPTSF